MSFIHNPKDTSDEVDENQPVKVSSVLGSLVTKGLLRRVSASQLLTVLGQGSLAAGSADQTVLSADESLKDILNEKLVDQIAYQQFVRASKFIVRKLKLDGGDQAIVMNGRLGCLLSISFVLLTVAAGRRAHRTRRVYRGGLQHSRGV